MATVTRAKIPAREFALYQTLREVPGAEFECERLVESGDGTVMPLIWARGADRETLREAFERDPSVSDVSLLGEFDDELLYRMHWIDQVYLVFQMVTTLEATVIDAYGDEQWWYLRILFPDRDALSRTNDLCESRGLTFEVVRVREMRGDPVGRFGLTREQYEALTMACDRGYFEVPRRTGLDVLADDLDISHQALSERLRRGTDVLVQETLLVGPRGALGESSQ
ncbi:bacterio-opsin activator domain-containing protein [Halomarina halobia]|uniref:Bacterio-opsin activator domain-containing protein n=1 Tax=Halomarina halobia TaxID=3033386 RepID=A0ABD6A5P4_9EURY|nr:helix-turn-helix domain-containing protein [Halomarina sp. PSR21]